MPHPGVIVNGCTAKRHILSRIAACSQRGMGPLRLVLVVCRLCGCFVGAKAALYGYAESPRLAFFCEIFIAASIIKSSTRSARACGSISEEI